MKWICCAVAGLALVCGGCGSGIGPKSIANERPAFNEELIQSTNQQLLTNLVRLRYLDAPMFLELSSVVAQYGWQANAGVDGRVAWNNSDFIIGGSNAGANGGITYSEHPTVSYAPLQGEEFAKRMLTPIPLETIMLLSRSGWSSERLMNLCAERMNGLENAVSASGPTPAESPAYEDFQKTSALMRKLSKQGVIVVVPDTDSGHRIALKVDEARLSDDATRENVATLMHSLGLPGDTRSMHLSSPFEPASGPTLVLGTRSMLGVLFYLSHSVQAPADHLQAGYIEPTKVRGTGAAFDWANVTRPLMTIKNSKDKPKSAYVAVRYRDYWFYIDDADRNSKATFGLLHYLISLQSNGGNGRTPLLTLPAGG